MHILKAVASSTLSLPADNYIYSIVASAPGSFAAISSDDSLRVFDAADIDCVSVISQATHDGVTSLQSFAMGDSHLLATGGRDGKVKIWDVRSGNGTPAVEMETGEFVLITLFWFFGFPFEGKFATSIARLGGFRKPAAVTMDGSLLFASAFPVYYYCRWLSGNLLALRCERGPVLIEFLAIKYAFTNILSLCPARGSPVLSVACNPETNTIVAGTELVSSQAVVAFWLVSSHA